MIKQIFKSAHLLAKDEGKVYPFVCGLKRTVKTMMAIDIKKTYDAVAKLQYYPQLDYEYYLLNRVQG